MSEAQLQAPLLERPHRGPRLVRSLVRIALGVIGSLVVLGIAAAWVVRGPLVRTPDPRLIEVEVSTDALRNTVDVLTTRFRNRWITHPETLDATAEWIEGQLRETSLEVTAHAFDLMEGTVRNVVAVRRGVDRQAPLIVIGAHYDSYGELPGADDNASGIAVLLELARTLPAEPASYALHLVAFVNEEPPFFGGDDEPGSQRFPVAAFGALYPDRGDFIAVIGDLRSGPAIARVKRAMLETRALPVYSFRGPTWIPGVDWSDHMSFRRLGFPAVMITDTAFLRNPRYHTRHDTADTLDYRRMAEVVRAVHGILRDAESPEDR